MHRYHSARDLSPSASFRVWALMPVLILVGTLLIIGIGSAWGA